MLTAKGEEADKIRGLETGADDYVTKPFSPSELMARAKAALRRARPQSGDENLTYADLEMDLATHRVRRDNKDLHLGPTEFRLLKFLMENQGRVFSREQLLDHVWGRDIYVEPRTVDVHIRAPPQGDQCRRPARPHPHRAVGGLRARYRGLIELQPHPNPLPRRARAFGLGVNDTSL